MGGDWCHVPLPRIELVICCPTHKHTPPCSTPNQPATSLTAVQAVKAMRYGAGGGAVKEFEDATALRERQEEELLAALEEMEEDD